MRWEKYYEQPQFGHMLFVDTVRQAAGCPAAAAVCGGENLRTDIHR